MTVLAKHKSSPLQRYSIVYEIVRTTFTMEPRAGQPEKRINLSSYLGFSREPENLTANGRDVLSAAVPQPNRLESECRWEWIGHGQPKGAVLRCATSSRRLTSDKGLHSVLVGVWLTMGEVVA